jgi:Acyclic terpene utilisation family protein AtuA
MSRPVRIANCSGFYGDRFRAARDMVEGGPIDVLTGDYLAELTMLILWKARNKDPGAGYARTFLAQAEQVIGACLDRGIKVVTNAGGLNPRGLAAQLSALADRLGLQVRVAHIEGDDIVERIPAWMADGHQFQHLDDCRSLASARVHPVTANAYLGGWGIVEALGEGADIVVCPRITDASLVVGPAAWWHKWGRDDYDALAGAVAAGHVIECGPQATGGNYAWLDEIVDRRYPGFPIAEVEADGSSVITKHEGTGGLVSPGTVTAQLLYEIAAPDYPNADVRAHFDTTQLTQIGPDRVRMSGTRGSAPPDTLKVAVNYIGGYRNAMTIVVTGLDIEEKARWAEDLLFDELGGRDQFDAVDVRLARLDRQDAQTAELASAQLTVSVKDRDRTKVGRRFSEAATALFLGSFAGFHTTTPPSAEREFGVYWPTLVPSSLVEHRVVLPDGSTRVVAGNTTTGESERPALLELALPEVPGGEVRLEPLGRVCAARSGDKGGNANVGLWTRDAVAYSWLRETMSVDLFSALLPESQGLEVRRFELPNLWAVNFVIVGLLGEGVASSTRPDPQAKGLGEYLRSRFVEIPVSLL